MQCAALISGAECPMPLGSIQNLAGAQNELQWQLTQVFDQNMEIWIEHGQVMAQDGPGEVYCPLWAHPIVHQIRDELHMPCGLHEAPHVAESAVQLVVLGRHASNDSVVCTLAWLKAVGFPPAAAARSGSPLPCFSAHIRLREGR